MQNGKFDLDLTDAIGERLRMKAGDYEFTLPADIPVTTVARIGRALTVIGKAMQDEGADDTGQIERAERELWACAEEVMAHSEPQPPTPLHGLFTASAMMGLLTFLVAKFNEVTNSMISSPSPTSSTVPLPSVNSSGVEYSTTAPSG